MTKPMRIDFVSDVSCPWCVIGLGGLEAALARVGDLVDATITLQPFELNPHMPAEGQNIGEHVREKYGATPEQSARNRDTPSCQHGSGPSARRGFRTRSRSAEPPRRNTIPGRPAAAPAQATRL